MFFPLNSSCDVLYAQSCFCREISQSFFCFPVGRPLGHTREPRGSGTALVILFSPRGRAVPKSWKRLCWTTGTHPRDMDLFELWSAVYRSTPTFFSHHFISFRCQISILCCECSYFPLGKGYFSSILCPLPKGLSGFWGSK